MKYHANAVTIARVDNGYVLTLHGWGEVTTLVALSTDVVYALLRDIEFEAPKPLPPDPMGPTPPPATFAVAR